MCNAPSCRGLTGSQVVGFLNGDQLLAHGGWEDALQRISFSGAASQETTSAEPASSSSAILDRRQLAGGRRRGGGEDPWLLRPRLFAGCALSMVLREYIAWRYTAQCYGANRIATWRSAWTEPAPPRPTSPVGTSSASRTLKLQETGECAQVRRRRMAPALRRAFVSSIPEELRDCLLLEICELTRIEERAMAHRADLKPELRLSDTNHPSH